MASLSDSVYVKDMQAHGPGRYAIVRVGDQLKDPETGRVMGYMGTYAASVRFDQVNGPVSRGLLVESSREAVAGDLLFSEDVQVPSSDIVPHAPPANFTGQIMAVVDGVSQIGQYDVVAINRGSNQGLEVGHVLAIDQKGEVVPDGSCKTFGRTSCARLHHAAERACRHLAGVQDLWRHELRVGGGDHGAGTGCRRGTHALIADIPRQIRQLRARLARALCF